MNKIIILGIVFVLLIISTIAVEMQLSLNEETIGILRRVGSGIGSITKERQLFDENGTNYANETYIDELKLINQNCDSDYCYFKLYESEGINKQFKIKLEKICEKEGMCIEFGEEYECCLVWRAETDQEVLSKAEAKTEEILNKIASVTLDREARSKVKRFEDIEITI